jgi:hypothetical protein
MRALRNNKLGNRINRRPRLEQLEDRRLFAADLAIVEPPTGDTTAPLAFQNVYNACDVNDDGRVNLTGDVIPMVLYLREVNSSSDGQPPAMPENTYLDATGDGVVRIGDLVNVITEIRRLTSLPQDEARISIPRLEGGVLWIAGTPEDEKVSVEEEGEQLVVRVGDAEARRCEFRFDRAAVTEIRYRSYGGDDQIANATDLAIIEYSEE